MAGNKDIQQWLTTESRMDTDIVPYLKYTCYNFSEWEGGGKLVEKSYVQSFINIYWL